MKITKDYEGLVQIENGDYVLEGDLISDAEIEIDLDDRLVVKGKIEAKTYIKAGWGIEAGLGIEAGGGIKAFKVKSFCHFSGLNRIPAVVYTAVQNNQIKLLILAGFDLEKNAVVLSAG